MGTDLDRCLNASDASHVDIRDQQLRLETERYLDRLLTTVDGASIKTRLVQNDGQSVGDDLFIVRDKNFILIANPLVLPEDPAFCDIWSSPRTSVRVGLANHKKPRLAMPRCMFDTLSSTSNCSISQLARQFCSASNIVRFPRMNNEAAKIPNYANTLLKAFDSELIARLHLEPVVFKTGQRIEQPGKAIRYLYFLEGGMASMTTLFHNGTEVEVGMFGYESVIGVSALMGTIQSLNHVYTQIAGTGYRCSYERALREFERFEVFHNLCLRYVQAQLVQSSQSAGCASMHNFEQRLARWLLISADRAHVETFKMSQEFLSHMLGSSRPTVSIVAGTLKKEKLIDYKRGVISILNRKGLEERSCECYKVVRKYLANYEQFDTAHTS